MKNKNTADLFLVLIVWARPELYKCRQVVWATGRNQQSTAQPEIVTDIAWANHRVVLTKPNATTLSVKVTACRGV